MYKFGNIIYYPTNIITIKDINILLKLKKKYIKKFKKKKCKFNNISKILKNIKFT